MTDHNWKNDRICHLFDIKATHRLKQFQDPQEMVLNHSSLQLEIQLYICLKISLFLDQNRSIIKVCQYRLSILSSITNLYTLPRVPKLFTEKELLPFPTSQNVNLSKTFVVKKIFLTDTRATADFFSFKKKLLNWGKCKTYLFRLFVRCTLNNISY